MKILTEKERENLETLKGKNRILSKRSGGVLTNQPTLIQMSNTFYPYQFCK